MEVVEYKSPSLWWDGHISPENSTWLTENVEGFEQSVKVILKMIEQDGVFSQTKIEKYDDKKPELATQITELICMHSVLAERYDHLIGEVRKNCASLHLDPSDSSSPQASLMLTPDHMTSVHKFKTPIGFDVLLSSAGSHASKREGSESSFSLSSDSDSDSFGSMNKLLFSPVNSNALKVKETKGPEVFLKKIANMEEKLVSLNTKLQNLEDENINLRSELIEKESVTELASNLQSQLESAQHVIKTQSAHLQTEKAKVDELQNQEAELKTLFWDAGNKIGTLGKELAASREKLIKAEDEISKLKHALSCKISEETQWLQAQLESTQCDMALLQRQLDSEKNKISELEEEISLYVADISMRDDQIRYLNTEIKQSMSENSMLKSTNEAKEGSWNADMEKLKVELIEKRQSINDLNKNFDAFKQKHDALMSDKDEVKAQLDTLQAEMRSKDNLTRELETRLNALQAEHVRVLASFDSSQKLTNELTVRVEELEREVDRQREVISERAEEKKEAIRQLCFSLDHYRSGYKELRQAYIGHKRHAHAVLAA